MRAFGRIGSRRGLQLGREVGERLVDLRGRAGRGRGLAGGGGQIQRRAGLHAPRDLGVAARRRREGGGQQAVGHLAHAGLGGVAAVLVDQAVQTLGGRERVQHHLGAHVGGHQAVVDRAAGGGEGLDLRLAVATAGLGRREQRDQPLGRIERRRGHGGQERGQRRALAFGRNRRRGRVLVALDAIAEVDAAHRLGGGLHLVAVQQVDWRELASERLQRLAGAKRALPELVDGDAANRHHPVELGDGVGAIVPDRAGWMAGVHRPRIIVLHEAQVLGGRLGLGGQDLLAGRTGRHVAVQPVDDEAVPVADVLPVGVGEVDLAAGQLHPRGRVVHHRNAALRRGAEVVREAQGVADLVGGEFAQAGDRDLHRIARTAGSVLVGADQALEDQHVLAHPERAQEDRALDDLAGARIGDRLAVGPAAGGAVDPVDDVVADVQRVGALRHDLHAIGVLEARRLEGLGPPARALTQRRTHRFRRGAVDVEDDGFLDRGDGL